jgi:hypothetical protein
MKILFIVLLAMSTYPLFSQSSVSQQDTSGQDGSKYLAPSVELIENSQSISGLNIFPNPATDNINIRFSTAIKSEITITLFNYLGNVLKTIVLMPENSIVAKSFILDELQPGLYVIQIRAGKYLVTKQIKKV